MNIFALEVWDDEASKCSFYTVRWADAERNETDKFFDKYDNIPALKTATQQLLSFVLDSIGEDHGAIDELFNRFEKRGRRFTEQGKSKCRRNRFSVSQLPP